MSATHERVPDSNVAAELRQFMDNFDFVEHLADTAHTVDVSCEIVETFIRSYYQDMNAVEAKWDGWDHSAEPMWDQAFAELSAVCEKYWLNNTRFFEYWQPSLSSPPKYQIADESGVTTYLDMLGNFVVIVAERQNTAVYLLAVIQDELKIVNRLFR